MTEFALPPVPIRNRTDEELVDALASTALLQAEIERRNAGWTTNLDQIRAEILRRMAPKHDLVALVRKYANDIQNGRRYTDVHQHLVNEVDELNVEMVSGDGPDGIVGESVDVITCALDLIYIYKPEMTDDEIMSLAEKKLDKWKRRYALSVAGDRTID